MQDVLEAVLQDPGIEKSAHEVMRTELDNATRLDRLVPIHEHLCQLDAHTRYSQAITTSGLDLTDQAALQASPAYGALVAELRRAENANLNIPELLHRAVNQSPLNNAIDLAAVLHTRVERLVTRTTRRVGHHETRIAGLTIPAAHVSDPTLIAPLREIESQIAQRADWLAGKAAREQPAWYQDLLRAVADRSEQETAIYVRQVAAYRERYNVQGRSAIGDLPPQNAIAQLAHHSRLVDLLTPLSPGDAAPHSTNPGLDMDVIELAGTGEVDSPCS